MKKIYTWQILSVYLFFPYFNSQGFNPLFKSSWTSLVVQWLRIRPPIQGTQFQSVVWEDPTRCGANKPMHHNYWACALGPTVRNYWARMLQLLKPTRPRAHAPQLLKPAHSSARGLQLLSLCVATTEARVPRAHAPQQEKPPQWEAPLTAMKSSPRLPQLEKARAQQRRPNAAKKKKVLNIYFIMWEIFTQKSVYWVGWRFPCI